LKVVQLTPWYHPHLGGVETHVRRISEELENLGCNVEIFTLTNSKQHNAKSFKHLFVPLVPEWLGLAPSPTLLTKVLGSNAEIVHAHSYGYPVVWAAALARKLRGVRFVFTPHSDPYSKIYPLFDLTRAIPARACDRLIAQSKYEAERLQKIGAEPGKIRVIPNGLDVGCAGSRPIHDPYILCLGRVVFRQKGQDLLLRAYNQSNFSQKLVFAGDGPDLSRLRNLAAGDRNVLILGALYSDRKWAWLGHADLVVVPSRTEAYGMVALEAIAMGRRLVVTKVGGLQHVATPYAVMAEPTSSSLAEAMGRALRASFTSELKVPTHSWSHAARETLRVYDEIAQ